MVNQTITLIWEEFQDRILFKPSSVPNREEIIHCKVTTFNPCHICDENCDCLIQFSSKHLDLNKLVDLNLAMCSLRLLPDSLIKLPLKSLNVSHNLLQSVPNCLFTGLEILENLDLSHNTIKEINQEPKCLSNLKILNLSNNGMKYIPIWLVHLKCLNLIELYYSNNVLGNTRESLFSKVSSYSLEKLICQSADLLNENILFIKSIKTLKLLDISNNELPSNRNSITEYEDLLDNPTWKNNIEVLNLSSLKIGFLPDDVSDLISLTELYLSGNGLYWLPDCLGNLENLIVLDIANNSLCLLPNSISNLKKIRNLNLERNKLSDITSLESLTTLEILDLYENELDCFNLDIYQYKYVDLEKNCFDAVVLGELYIDIRDQYREKFNLKHRMIGCNVVNLEISINDAESNSKCSDEEPENFAMATINYFEEECWDDEKIHTHPDITSSDDEWQGYFPIRNQPVQKPTEILDHLLDDLYADVD